MTNPIGTTNVTLTIDGKENKFKDARGQDVVAKLTWNAGQTEITSHTQGKQHMTVKRSLTQNITNHKGKTMTRAFTKK